MSVNQTQFLRAFGAQVTLNESTTVPELRTALASVIGNHVLEGRRVCSALDEKAYTLVFVRPDDDTPSYLLGGFVEKYWPSLGEVSKEEARTAIDMQKADHLLEHIIKSVSIEHRDEWRWNAGWIYFFCFFCVLLVLIEISKNHGYSVPNFLSGLVVTFSSVAAIGALALLFARMHVGLLWRFDPTARIIEAAR